MADFLRRRSSPPTDLMQIIGEVRSRWRMKLALRGLVTTFAIVVALILGAAYAMEWARFSPASIIAARVLVALGIVASAGYFLVRPLRRRVSDDQVALYLEENEPSLQATLVSAVEAHRSGAPSMRREASTEQHRSIACSIRRRTSTGDSGAVPLRCASTALTRVAWSDGSFSSR
jgi:hypothetical protein